MKWHVLVWNNTSTQCHVLVWIDTFIVWNDMCGYDDIPVWYEMTIVGMMTYQGVWNEIDLVWNDNLMVWWHTIFGQGMMTYHMVWIFRMFFPDAKSAPWWSWLTRRVWDQGDELHKLWEAASGYHWGKSFGRLASRSSPPYGCAKVRAGGAWSRHWRLHGPNPGATGTTEQAAGSRSPPTEAVRQLAASRVVFDDIMVFDLEAQLASHDGLWPTRYEPTKWHPDHSSFCLRLACIFTPFCCACERETKCTFGQVDQGEQSHQPSHHGDHALRLRSLNWCAPVTTRMRTDSHFWFFRTAPITLRILLICDSYPLFLCICIYSTYFLTLHIFLLWPHFGFDMLFDLYVLLFALREAFKL